MNSTSPHPPSLLHRLFGPAPEEHRAQLARDERLALLEGQWAALRRGQAILEYAVDGTIVDANENYLAMLGYAVADVKGQHHSLLVDPALRGTDEYRAFWDRMARGDIESTVARRIGKGGKVVWMRVTCTPVPGTDGRPARVVEMAVDVTAERERLAEVTSELKVRTEIMNITSIVSE